MIKAEAPISADVTPIPADRNQSAQELRDHTCETRSLEASVGGDRRHIGGDRRFQRLNTP